MADTYVIAFGERPPVAGDEENVHEITAELEGHDRTVVEEHLQEMEEEGHINWYSILVVESDPVQGESAVVSMIDEALQLEEDN